MSLLTVKNLTRSYGSLQAVRDVTFECEAGQILGFIGPNGAGKSTTMRIIATLDVPSGGDVLLDGKSVVARPDQARPLIGYMPDRYGTYEDMTVFEFLDFFARAYKLRGAERKARVDSVMEFAGLTTLQHKLTSALSKGMKQRVALGRTLLHDPKLLILDEPADGLDPRARIELRELLRALAQQGKAVLISSHILTELAEIIDTCAIIEQGQLLATGTVQEVLAKTAGVSATVQVEARLLPSAVNDALAKKVERLLLEQPQVSAPSVSGELVRFTLGLAPGVAATPAWAEEAQVRVLRALVAAEVPVVSFGSREHDLEDAFMSVTRGRVQ
jgi:ABC-2 type transport system ATP-binding protein